MDVFSRVGESCLHSLRLRFERRLSEVTIVLDYVNSSLLVTRIRALVEFVEEMESVHCAGVDAPVRHELNGPPKTGYSEKNS